MDRKKKLLVLGCSALLLLCCISSAALVIYGHFATEKMDGAKAACRRQAIPGAPRRVAHTMQPVAAFERSSTGDWLYNGSALPVAWPHAEESNEPAIVFCFENEEREILETCSYESNSTYTRVQFKQRVIAIEASTGVVLGEKFVMGEPPEPCPDSMSVRRSAGSARREGEGDSPDGDDIEREFGELFR